MTTKNNAQQAKIQRLEAKVAELEKRLDELQHASQRLTSDEQTRAQSYRKKYDQHVTLDANTHTQAQIAEVEKAYEAIETNFGSDECLQAHQKFITQYPGFNRTGCAVCELGGMATFGPEAEQYFKECLQKYDDCYWGDGVQVGPFARYNLAIDYQNTGQKEKAEALFQEIRTNYPDALDHRGELLVDTMQKH